MKTRTIHVGAIPAVFFTLFGTAACADVIIFGNTRAGVQYLDDGAAKALIGPTAGAQIRVDGVSNILFKGDEDLGDGLKALWQVHTRFGTDGSGLSDKVFKGPNPGTNGTFGNQDTFIGFKGGWGMLRLGNATSNFGEGKYDKLLVEGFSNNGRFFGFGGAGKNMVRYDLPSFGKLTGSYQWWTGEDKTSTASAMTGNSVRMDYGSAADPWSVGAGYSKSSDVRNADGSVYGDKSQANATAGINFDNGFTLAAEYQVNTHEPVGAASYKVKNLGLYGYYTLGKVQLGLQYGQSKDDSTSLKTKASALMAHYVFTKRTKGYAEFLHKKPDNAAAQNLMIVGLSTTF